MNTKKITNIKTRNSHVLQTTKDAKNKAFENVMTEWMETVCMEYSGAEDIYQTKPKLKYS